jgi:hypothetical protein
VRGGSLKFSGQRQSIHRRATSRAATRRREIALYDGQTFLGRIVMRSTKRFEAFGPTGSLLGKFSTVSEAYDACTVRISTPEQISLLAGCRDG